MSVYGCDRRWSEREREEEKEREEGKKGRRERREEGKKDACTRLRAESGNQGTQPRLFGLVSEA